MKNIFIIATSVVTLGVLPSPVTAQDVTASGGNASRGKVTDWLETSFERMMKECLPDTGKIKVKGKSIVSPVPTELITTALKKPNSYISLDTISSNIVFGYVFEDRAIDKIGDFTTPNPLRLLDIDYETIRPFVSSKASNYATGTFTCQEAISASAGIGAEFKEDTLKAAARAALAGKFNQRADLAYGTFGSPIVNMWLTTGTDGRPAKFLAAQLFYEWYNRNGAGASGELIHNVEGWAYQRVTVSNSKKEASASASFSLPIPFLTAKSSINKTAEIASISGTTNYEFKILEKDGKGWGLYKFTLPNRSDVIDAIEDNAKIDVAFEGSVFEPGKSVQFDVNVTGMLKDFCEGQYKLVSTLANKLNLVSNSYITELNGGTCQFRMDYIPDAIPNGLTLSIPFDLKYNGNGNTIEPFSLSVIADLAISDSPKLVIGEVYKKVPTVSNMTIDSLPSHKLTWTIPFKILDNNKVSQVDADELFLENCSVESSVFKNFDISTNINPRVSMESRTGNFTVTTTTSDLSAANRDARQICYLSGTIKYLIEGKLIGRTMPKLYSISVPNIENTTE